MAFWRVFLIFVFINVLFLSQVLTQVPNGVLDSNFNKTCSLTGGRDGICVYAYLCRDNVINNYGAGIIDLRFSDECETYLLKCCSIETSCANDKGTCVAADRCEVQLNSPKYKLFKESDECEWNDYQCCPKEKVRKAGLQDAECDVDSICVPDAECNVQPDGGGLLEPRISVCKGHETCCPRHQLNISSNPCEEVGGQCVPQGQCRSVFSVDIRTQLCDDPGFMCCTDTKATTSPPSVGKSCVRGSGTCVRRKDCKGTVYKDRENECSGLVCCGGTVGTTVTSPTTRKPINPGKSCVENSGICTPRKECKGTAYRDRNNECEGLVCCAVFTPTVWVPSTTTPRPSGGKSCFNNNGKCTPRSECRGTVYKDRHNECAGLVCCASQGAESSSTPGTIVTSTSTRKPVTPGKACSGNSGKCIPRRDCKGTVYRDPDNACEGLVCCAEPATTCSSMKGLCVAEKTCRRKSTNIAADCRANTVCCLEVEIKDCGYRNERGIEFSTVNRNDGESQYGEFPWMVAIMIDETESVKYSCGGSLIHPEVVLTSAECVKLYRRALDKLIIRAGEWDMGLELEPFPYQERRVIKIVSHSEFQPNTLVNNVALVFLDDAFDLNPIVNTICLPPQDFQVDNGEVTATGWGTTPQNRSTFQQILKSMDMPYTPKPDCERTLRKATSNKRFKLHSSFLCAGGMLGVDTCSGDAGSPVIYNIPDDAEFRYYAIGMVSWGVGCGRSGTPAVYTDIGVFREWIDREMELEGLDIHYYQYQS